MGDMSSKEAYRFKREVEELAAKRGRGTELVSVYIPATYELSKIINKLAEEQGTASNIKSSGTRKNVVSALEKIIQHLKLFKRTPENGLVVFCGNVSEGDSPDIQLWSIIPHEPNKLNLYRCEKQFIVEPLMDMVQTKTMYGLIVMDRREGNVAFLKGKRIDMVKTMHSMVPGKFRAGGQSAARFGRVIEGLANDFYKEVGESANSIFMPVIKDLKGVIIGGPGPTKYTFAEGHFLTEAIKGKILGILDIGYTGPDGLEELLTRSDELLKDAEVQKEKKLVIRFIDVLAKGGAVAYGLDNVRKACDAGAAETIMVSEKLPPAIADEFMERADKTGAKVEFISTETREGEQLYQMGGIAAFLRYKIEF